VAFDLRQRGRGQQPVDELAEKVLVWARHRTGG
jgi:hypothetical protein